MPFHTNSFLRSSLLKRHKNETNGEGISQEVSPRCRPPNGYFPSNCLLVRMKLQQPIPELVFVSTKSLPWDGRGSASREIWAAFDWGMSVAITTLGGRFSRCATSLFSSSFWLELGQESTDATRSHWRKRAICIFDGCQFHRLITFLPFACGGKILACGHGPVLLQKVFFLCCFSPTHNCWVPSSSVS